MCTCTGTGPVSIEQALRMIRDGMGYLADLDAASLTTVVLGETVRGLEQADAVEAVARGSCSRRTRRRTGTWPRGRRCCGPRRYTCWGARGAGGGVPGGEVLDVRAWLLRAGLRQGDALTPVGRAAAGPVDPGHPG
jgi:hypothetical protein